jgi:hypothetical protein
MKHLLAAIGLTVIAATANAADFGEGDIPAIVDASQHNPARFDRDFKGRSFTARGAFTTATACWLSNDCYLIHVRVGRSQEALCSITISSAEIADWDTSMPVVVSGPILTTILGSLSLGENCSVKKVP